MDDCEIVEAVKTRQCEDGNGRVLRQTLRRDLVNELISITRNDLKLGCVDFFNVPSIIQSRFGNSADFQMLGMSSINKKGPED